MSTRPDNCDDYAAAVVKRRSLRSLSTRLQSLGYEVPAKVASDKRQAEFVVVSEAADMLSDLVADLEMGVHNLDRKAALLRSIATVASRACR